MTFPRSQTVRIGDYPQLHLVAWHLAADTHVTELDALHLYERNWRFVAGPDQAELAFIRHLCDTYSHGKPLV